MKNILIGFLCSLIFVGCTTSEKLTYPKGRWTEINNKNFIPENTKKFVKDTVNEDIYNEISK